MLGYDQFIYENICTSTNADRIEGHVIMSVEGGSVYDPQLKGLVSERVILCTRCGMSLDEIRTQKVKKTRTRKPKDQPSEVTE